MDKHKQNIALAKFLGLKVLKRDDDSTKNFPYFLVGEYGAIGKNYPTEVAVWLDIEDYMSSLIHIERIRNKLNEEQKIIFVVKLTNITLETEFVFEWPAQFLFLFINATAAQQAEAILKAIEKWEDDK